MSSSTSSVWVSQVLTLFFVITGWIVVNRQNNKRETRKEGRSACDACKKYALDITLKGKEYYLSRDQELAFDIKSELDLLETELGRIPYFGIGDNSSLMKAYIKFSESITADDFEERDAKKLSANDEKIQKIVRSRNELMQEIERQFKMQFCS